jgi:hypothetical protein
MKFGRGYPGSRASRLPRATVRSSLTGFYSWLASLALERKRVVKPAGLGRRFPLFFRLVRAWSIVSGFSQNRQFRLQGRALFLFMSSRHIPACRDNVLDKNLS